MTVSQFGMLEDRLAQVEELLDERERTGSADRAG